MPALFGWTVATRSEAGARSREIAAVLARQGFESVLEHTGLARLPWLRKRKLETVEGEAARLRRALGELGGTFVKLGQMLSTRGDLLPPEFVEELGKLTDAAPRVPFADVRAIVEQELGATIEASYATFDAEPLASASLGQVHAATLADGTDVVVKVQRPHVAALVEQDLVLMRNLARWLRDHAAWAEDLNVEELVDEFAFTIRGELDYLQEARHATRMRNGFAGRSEVWIPGVVVERTTRRVLTLERARGIRIADLAALDRAGIARRAVAENAVRIFLHEVLVLGFFHADPHPGNFFVRPDGSLELVDFGMVGRVSPDLGDRLLRLGLATLRRDAPRVTELVFALGVVGEGTHHDAVQRDVERLFDRYAGVTIKELAASDAVRELTALAYRHHLRLPTDLALLARVLAMSEGLGLRLDPEFKFFDYASPYIRRHWQARNSPIEWAKRLGKAAAAAGEVGPELPGRVFAMLGRLERGELDMTIHHEGLSRFSHDLEGMTNRLALAILLGATIIALGLSLVVVHPPGWGRIAGRILGFAFVASLVFGVWLLVSIWHSRRRPR